MNQEEVEALRNVIILDAQGTPIAFVGTATIVIDKKGYLLVKANDGVTRISDGTKFPESQ